ncbi:MAG TPA: hypothetical protein VF559_02255 [Caulobacteraceae bacterium]|jgi:hypothetical protein
MYLAADDLGAARPVGGDARSSCELKWRDWPASTLSHHGRACCEIAREWVLAMDYSQLADASPLSGPRWVRQRYPWGPSAWPLHWCEAVERKRLDCGAHAAISHQIFAARGVESYPAQFVQQYSHEATSHWGLKWGEEEVTAAWIDGDVIYHEGCAVRAGPDEVKLWDASAGWWIDPEQRGGYGALLSVRVRAPDEETFAWGRRTLRANIWHNLAAGDDEAIAAQSAEPSAPSRWAAAE